MEVTLGRVTKLNKENPQYGDASVLGKEQLERLRIEEMVHSSESEGTGVGTPC